MLQDLFRYQTFKADIIPPSVYYSTEFLTHTWTHSDVSIPPHAPFSAATHSILITYLTRLLNIISRGWRPPPVRPDYPNELFLSEV